MFPRTRSWFRTLYRGNRVRGEIDEELQFHIDSQIAEFIAGGMPPREARRQARILFGGLEALREETREAHGIAFAEALVLDTRFALRTIRRSPGFAATAVVTLGLSIGAVATTLTIAHALLWKTLSVPAAERLVEIIPTRDHGTELGFVSYPDYAHFQAGLSTVEGLAAAYPAAPLFVATNGPAREMSGALVSANFFGMLGLRPVVGRFFTTEEDSVPNRDRVAVLSYDYWRDEFASAPDIVGRQLEVNSVGFSVVGVAPQGFHGLSSRPAEIYLPTMMLPVGYRWCSVINEVDCTILSMYGRLKAGASLETAQAEVGGLLPSHWQGEELGANTGAIVSPVRGTQPGKQERVALALLATAAGLLLLVCCANLAGLLLSRARQRSSELSIRSSLGASRNRLVRQLVTESALVGVASGALGLGCSLGFTRALEVMFYTSDYVGRPLRFDFELSLPVCALIFALSLAVGLLYGSLPALLLSNNAVVKQANRRGFSMATRSGGRWLIGLQAASAVALVVVAGLLTGATRDSVAGINSDPSNVVRIRVRPRLIGYQPEQAQRYLQDVRRRIEALPETRSMSLLGGSDTEHVSIDDPYAGSTGIGDRGSTSELTVRVTEIGQRYFETLGTPLLLGREFSGEDRIGSEPVVIVSDSFVRSAWSKGGSLGRTIRISGEERRVIGVVADLQQSAWHVEPLPGAYIPFWQDPNQVDARLLVRVHGAHDPVLAALSKAAQQADADVPVTELVSMPRLLKGSLRSVRMGMTMVTFAGILVILLCAIGLYSAITAAVTERRREIGIRLALGAVPRSVVELCVRDGLRTLIIGIASGVAVAAAAVGVLRNALFALPPANLSLYLGASVLLAAVGAAACIVPARRAASAAPVDALRLE